MDQQNIYQNNDDIYREPYPVVPDYDPGESEAKDCKLYGILSIFILPIIFIPLGFWKYHRYKQVGNGLCVRNAKIGRTLCIISIVLQVLLIGFLFYWASANTSFAVSIGESVLSGLN